MKNEVKNFYGFSHPSSLAVYLNEYSEGGPHVIETNESLFESIEQSFRFFNPDQNVYTLPTMDPWFPSRVVTLKRLKWLYRALSANSQDIFLCSKKSLSQKTIPKEEFQKNFIFIDQNSKLPSDQTLSQMGYLPSEQVEEIGFFSRRGYILDIFSPCYPHPVRIETIGDEIKSIRFFDCHTGRSLQTVSSVKIIPAIEIIFDSESRMKAIQKLKSIRKSILDFPDHLIKKLARGQFFPEVSLMAEMFYDSPALGLDFFGSYTLWVDESAPDISLSAENTVQEKKTFHSFLIESFFSEKIKNPPSKVSLNPMIYESKNVWPVQVIKNLSWSSLKQLQSCIFIGFSHTAQLERIQFYLNKEGFESYLVTGRDRFWKTWQEEQANSNKVYLIPESIPNHFKMNSSYFLSGSLLLGKAGAPISKRQVFTSFKASALNFSDISEGDLLVDRLYGVGLYRGLKKLTLSSAEGEYVELEYKDKDKLYVPVSQLGRLFHFKSSLSKKILDSLGGSQWAQKMAKAKKTLQQMVLELLKLYSTRFRIQRPPFSKPGKDMKMFEDQFPFEETPDQLRAIKEVLEDMSKSNPMERLIIGDSGYGKTEVAMRAAFKAVEDGFQAAFLAPTTILSLQHFESFKQRFKDWPIRIELVNRLIPSAQVKNILKDLAQGKVDVLIGSHRLLSSDVQFKKLGLLVIDEEHRFGVRQKEKLKKVQAGVDCIYMSATPIPRTLHLSLSRMKDISIISTPPKNRIRPEVFVFSFQKEKIRRAVQQELSRGGQVLFVHNRVQSLNKIQDKLKEILPDVQMAVVHGQMDEQTLETNILKFFNHEYDVLICTTIIETGMDFERANTIIIDDAHLLGLSQLYQLKGRVGRRAHIKPYCYFVVPEPLISRPAVIDRLNFLQTHNQHNSGYQVARYDLETRGGGEFLGAKQSGHLQNIGYDLYLEMLEDCVHPQEMEWEPEIQLPWPAFIPAFYMPSDKIRLMYYKYLCDVQDVEKLDELEVEWKDNFGNFPQEVKNLLGQIRISKKCKELKIKELKVLNNFVYVTYVDPELKKEKFMLDKNSSWLDVYDILISQ
ncbi:MAG: transcription-repair coupling factor [Bdellovibrionales bacterium]|nr:transcription-repair coupling factor [Bdellovibrionales bacterium]